MKYSLFVALSLALAATARPSYLSRRADFSLQNGKDAIALNDKFKTLSASSPCQAGEDACVNDQFAQCVSGKFVTQACAAGTICAALPLVNSAGTSITCTTAADRDARIAATGATSGSTGSSAGASAASSVAATATTSSAAASSTASTVAGDNSGDADSGDAQQSLTLLNSVIATGFANDGQDQPEAGQVASATSTNNFINFCATVPNKQITNGLQVKEGSCNPAPMGVIASTANMPSCKFVSPKNGDKIAANTNFTIQMAIKNLNTGFFTNPNENYFAAPQTVDGSGNINGHSHVVVEALPSLDTTTPTDPTKFTFFKGLNDKAQGGVLSVEVAGGLPAGTYRLASINSAANHQPALVAVAQHGALDDMVYFTVA
ncbi:hypothetical protein K466DRAFT_169146 [Polyporus arcularius HHB13444]|uniref:Carbohydrate-binding module family 19 domain-containing protein n=1 Tax=Polyporus arcularius HHB13444 TaxID=1314778 RepID=A0A5C3PWD3_9APHY|nr:hypothetical protein K466DRAFT_169146 [Polyporus arcularius HHB13444]